MMNNTDISSDLAIPPGEYLEEVLEELGMTKNELAHRMNRPAPKLSAIFSGNKAITPDTALQLEKVVGVPAHIWTGLEAEYQLVLARKQDLLDLERLNDESKLVKTFCYSDLVKLGMVAKRTNPIEKVQELHSFFGITSLNNISTLKRYQVAFRQGGGKRSPESTAAWLRIGELYGQKAVTKPYSKGVLNKQLPALRALTQQLPEIFMPKLKKILLESGVVLVLCPHLPKTYLHGATFWLGKKKAVLMLTNRGSWADIFWFSLFHEIGHLLLHGKQMVFLEGEGSTHRTERFEKEADKFAADLLIPSENYEIFLQQMPVSKKKIESFSDSIDIHPGILVGRLQNDKIIPHSMFNELRSRYSWKCE